MNLHQALLRPFILLNLVLMKRNFVLTPVVQTAERLGAMAREGFLFGVLSISHQRMKIHMIRNVL